MNKSINVLKCVAAFAVICIHCTLQISGNIGEVLDALMRFAVPVFFLISGYYSFFNDEDLEKAKYKKRILKLIKLIILSNLLYFIFEIFLNNSYMNFFGILKNKFTVKACFSYLILNASPTSGHLWFLSALLYCYIIYFVMSKFKVKHQKLYKYIPILLIANIMMGEITLYMNVHIVHMYYRNFLFTGIPFFTLGYLIHDKQEKIQKCISNKNILFTLLLSSGLIVLERLSTGRVELHLGTIFFAIGAFIWCVLNSNKLNLKFASWIGKNLYTSIYILQGMVITLLGKYEENLVIPKEKLCYINTIVIFAITTLISAIIHLTFTVIPKILKKGEKYET